MKAMLPENELARLAYLRQLQLLDTEHEKSFDDIAYLAMSVCGTAIGVISLVDRDRQWFKSCVGIAARETSRDIAFCAHAILQPDQLLIVEDASKDSRFSQNPLVLGEPHIRFYAGAPLVSPEGYALGTLCVIDSQPRQLNELQVNTLQILARQVMQLLQLRELNHALQLSQLTLRESKEQFDGMLSNFPGAVYRCQNNADWSMLYVSTAVEQLTGYSAERFLRSQDTLSFTQITHPEDVPVLYEKVQQALAARTSFELLFRLHAADGSWRWVQEVGRGVFDEQGELKYIDGFMWDVTEAETARLEVAVNEQKLSSLYDQAPVAIALNALEDGRFLECNPEFQRITGYSHADLLNLQYWDLTPIEYSNQEQQQLESLRLYGRYGPYEKCYRHRNGELVPVVLNGVLINSPEGEPQIWSFVQDISERKRAEQLKNDFVSAVSHELRTPLTSISSALGMVVGGMLGDLPEATEKVLTIAHKNSLRLTYLINDLLDMEKLSAGQMTFDLRAQPLVPIIQHSLENNQAYADNYGVSLVFNSQLDPLEQAPTVLVDSYRLQQVMANFISNAVKFSARNGQVELQLIPLEHEIKIAVVDQGPGISEPFRERIFQKFSQADSSSSRQRGGTGLGLAISKTLVEQMHGTIGFDSVPGQGATFYAIFPLVQAGSDPSSVTKG